MSLDAARTGAGATVLPNFATGGFMSRFLFVLALSASCLLAQDEPNPKTLIPQKTLEAIADEVSGTLAYQNILELAGFEHDRLSEEYKSTCREARAYERQTPGVGAFRPRSEQSVNADQQGSGFDALPLAKGTECPALTSAVFAELTSTAA